MTQLFSDLRNRYPRFIFRQYQFHQTTDTLHVTYRFEIEALSDFTVNWEFPLPEQFASLEHNTTLERLVFSLGMVELISYWKLTCSPEVLVEAGALNSRQIQWWKDLYFNGLGEFFYKNNISTDMDSFMNLSAPRQTEAEHFCTLEQPLGALIPIGGGKDSIVTLQLLRDSKEYNSCYIINPRGATLSTCETGGYQGQTLIAKRSLDPAMLELNKKGFLNGHTPFSAIVAFSSVLTAYLHNLNYVVLSNESSANESTIKDSSVNHQFSKSASFEHSFHDYEAEYIRSGVSYFSLLRPLNELQIARYFSTLTEFHPVFRSCNAGSKTDSWCCNCPKCLFVYIILSPFLSQEALTQIFGENLLDKDALMPYFEQLIGVQEEKPFECVGSRDEVNAAIRMTIKRLEQLWLPLPSLLGYYKTLTPVGAIPPADSFLTHFDHDNLLPDYYRALLIDNCF